MQRLIFIVILAIILIALPLLILSDTDTSTADEDIPENEVTSSISKASNASVTFTIMITIAGALNE